MTEIWKDIISYEGLYEISNLGRAKRKYKKAAEKILKPVKGHLGYMCYSLGKDSKIKTFRIHRLVAIHFIPNPNGYREVNHKDGNKENYYVDNLEWCSRSENMKHAHGMGLIHIDKAVEVISKLNIHQIEIIRKMRSFDFTLHEISILCGVSISRLSRLLNNQNPLTNIK